MLRKDDKTTTTGKKIELHGGGKEKGTFQTLRKREGNAPRKVAGSKRTKLSRERKACREKGEEAWGGGGRI